MLGYVMQTKNNDNFNTENHQSTLETLDDIVNKVHAKSFKVGVKQSQKAIDMGYVHSVYVARDAQKYVIKHVLELANSKTIPIYWVDSMKTLGHMCKIDVSAAIAVVTK